MELGPALPAELLPAAAPLHRGFPEFLRPPSRAPGADAAPAPFELLLQLLGNQLPGGETLPVGGSALPPADASAPQFDAPPAPLDAATAAVAGLALPLPLPLALPGGPAAERPGSAAGTAGPQVSLQDAPRLAFGGAPPASAPPPTLSSVAESTAAEVAATGAQERAESDAPAPPPVGERPAAQAQTPAALDTIFALDARAPAAAAESFMSRPRAADETRARALSVTPAERALALATQLARADAAAQPRADTPLPRALQAQAPLPVPPDLIRTAPLDDALPLNVAAPAAGDASPGAFTLVAPHASAGTSTAAQASAAMPAHFDAPVDASSARWHEALASRIHWLVDHEIGEAQIKLNPPELGALDVKISMLDDKTYVQMTAHTSAARDELTQSLPRLRELMSAGGLNLGGATVSNGRGDRSGYQAAAQPVALARAFAPEQVDSALALPRLRLHSASRIDLFA